MYFEQKFPTRIVQQSLTIDHMLELIEGRFNIIFPYYFLPSIDTSVRGANTRGLLNHLYLY